MHEKSEMSHTFHISEIAEKSPRKNSAKSTHKCLDSMLLLFSRKMQYHNHLDLFAPTKLNSTYTSKIQLHNW